MNKIKGLIPKKKKKRKALIAQYEVKTGRDGKLVDFGADFTDIIVIDKFSQQTLAWDVKDAKKKMGLSVKESSVKVIPYLINELLIAIQETDFEKLKNKEIKDIKNFKDLKTKK